MQEFVFELGKGILNGLKPRGRKTWELFLKCLSSLRTSISFDFSGNPNWNLEMGDIKTPAITLDEIFHYLEQADKPCLISIDEFKLLPNIRRVMLRLHYEHTFSIVLMQNSFMLARNGI